MALKQFVIPLDDKSVQSGDITFKQLVDNGQPVTFKLTNVSSGSTNELNLVTSKNGGQTMHRFSVIVSSGNAMIELSADQVKIVYDDSDGVDWDYVLANWTLGGVDTPNGSVQYETQSGIPYDTHWFPPKPKH